MKVQNLVFLVVSAYQALGSLKLIALISIPSMWGSQNDMLQHLCLGTKVVYSDHGEIRIVNELIQKTKVVQLFAFKFNFFIRISFNIFRLYRKIEIFPHFLESLEKHLFHLRRRTKIC